MKPTLRLFFLLLTLPNVCPGSLSFAQSTALSAKVDSLFAPWNKPDSPGCVCGVIKDQLLLYAKGYGTADLEHDVPITPQSVFYIASTSKQFTASSIALLALDKKLSLNDDIHTYLPEIPSYGKPIRINDLLHHTSGLKDHFELMYLAGWHESDYTNNEMVLRLVAHQRTLNFETGTKHEYSNTNYMLLAEIVRKVSGKSLRLFAQERIFTPLGMNHTHFDDDYPQVVKQRVISYAPPMGGTYIQLLKDFDLHGDGNLLTTVEDLQRWDANFYTGKVGGVELTKMLLTKGVLTSGDTIPYALGLGHGHYKGLPIVSHTGGFKGFRTQLLRFPDQHFSVAVLCNLGSINAYELANKVADIYLDDQFKNVKSEKPQAVASTDLKNASTISLKPELLKKYAGVYQLGPGWAVTLSQERGQLMTQANGEPKFPTEAKSDSVIWIDAYGASMTFVTDKNGSVNLLRYRTIQAKRITPWVANPTEFPSLKGTYYSPELAAEYTVDTINGKLIMHHRRIGDFELSADPTEVNGFSGKIGNLSFVKNAQKKVTGFMAGSRVKNIWFEKR